MSKEIAKQQMCLLLKNNIEYWYDMDRMDQIRAMINPPMGQQRPEFIELPNGELIAVSSIDGLHTPEALEDRKRHRQGQWKCLEGKWHTRQQEDCTCTRDRQIREEQERLQNNAQPTSPDQVAKNKKAMGRLRKSLASKLSFK